MPDTYQLPEPELGYIKTDISNQPAFSARQMREAMRRSTQAEVTDLTIERVFLDHGLVTTKRSMRAARAILALRPEPVACATPDGLKSNWRAHHVIVNKAALQMVRNALRNDVERGLKVRGEMLAELDSATFQAHPAPSVRDAERYRWLRDPKNHAQIGVGQWTDDGFGWRYSDEADAAIDAAMLAAK